MDDYYDRPDWLAQPIYPQLESRGNFKNFLALIDKAGYKNVLDRAGYFTVFAPTDSAFNNFLTEHSYSSVSDIDTLTAKKIVSYAMVYNAYTTDQLDDYQSTASKGLIPDRAFKRRTYYYKWVYDDTVNREALKVIDINGVTQQIPGTAFNSNDNNNKHIPYFTTNFLAIRNLSAYDYNYFFPETEFSGFNVVDAKVIEPNVLAENGVLHITNKVLMPLPNLEELLASNPNYSEFKGIIDMYLREYYQAPADFLARVKQFSNLDDVFLKYYSNLEFSPNCENFLRYGGGEDNDAQIDGWTFFVPTNEAVRDFLDNKFLSHYSSLKEMPTTLIAEFINAHMFRTSVWPSKFSTTTNPFGEDARFDAEHDVVEKKIASNGIFYGVNKVQMTDKFYTLAGDVSLSPEYTLFKIALQSSLLDDVIENPRNTATLFLIPNDDFAEIGLSYDGARNSWNLSNPALGTNASVALKRLMNLHIVLNKKLSSFSGDGIVETYGGEYMRYSANYIWAAGNYPSLVRPSNRNNKPSNGISYVLSSPLLFSVNNVGADIEGRSAFTSYFKYLQKSAESNNKFIYDSENKAIINVANTDNNTILIPNDSAIQAAVRDGVLPAIPANNPFTNEELDKVLAFVMYHIIAKTIVVPDGVVQGFKSTYYKTVEGTVLVNVVNSPGSLSIIDKNNRVANVITSSSNVLSNRAVIHLIDNYLKY